MTQNKGAVTKYKPQNESRPEQEAKKRIARRKKRVENGPFLL